MFCMFCMEGMPIPGYLCCMFCMFCMEGMPIPGYLCCMFLHEGMPTHFQFTGWVHRVAVMSELMWAELMHEEARRSDGGGIMRSEEHADALMEIVQWVSLLDIHRVACVSRCV